MRKFHSFIKEYWGYLLVLVIALTIFGGTLRTPLSTHFAYMSAKETGDMLGMGEMRVNQVGYIQEDGSIVLPTGGTMFGPYFNFPAGDYVLEVVCTGLADLPLPTISITSDGGVGQLGSFPLSEGRNQLGMTLDSNQTRVEFVVRNEVEGQELTISALTFALGAPTVTPTPVPTPTPLPQDTQSTDLLPQMLHNELGERTDAGIVLFKGGILYGPYLTLAPGTYQLHLMCDFDASQDSLELQATAENGSKELSTWPLSSGQNVLEFTIEVQQAGVEFVVINEVFEEIKIAGFSIHNAAPK